MLAFLERHVVACLLGAVVAVFLIYEISVQFVAYSSDAYVESNVILVAPEVSGPLTKVMVHDDDWIEAGAGLAEIDPTPFQIAVALAQANVDLADKRAATAADAIAESQASLAAAQASKDDADQQLTRDQTLIQTRDVSDEALDTARRNALVAGAEVRKAQGLLTVAESLIAERKAEQAASARALDKARYELSRTRIVAPVAGRVAPLTTRAGDFAHAGEAVAAIVSNENWRIYASVNERHLKRLRVGQAVWYTIGSDPWRLHVGSVRSIAPGIARSETPERALPYAPLETDWIRLPRRFPVVVDLGEAARTLPLYRGADARVWIWF